MVYPAGPRHSERETAGLWLVASFSGPTRNCWPVLAGGQFLESALRGGTATHRTRNWWPVLAGGPVSEETQVRTQKSRKNLHAKFPRDQSPSSSISHPYRRGEVAAFRPLNHSPVPRRCTGLVGRPCQGSRHRRTRRTTCPVSGSGVSTDIYDKARRAVPIASSALPLDEATDQTRFGMDANPAGPVPYSRTRPGQLRRRQVEEPQTSPEMPPLVW